MASTPPIPGPPPRPESSAPGAAQTGQTGIEVTAKFFWLQWLLYFFKPTVAIDGARYTDKWGTYFFQVAPGRHRVEVSFRYLFMAEAGKGAIDVDISAGEVKRVRYRPPWVVFMKGRMSVA